MRLIKRKQYSIKMCKLYKKYIRKQIYMSALGSMLFAEIWLEFALKLSSRKLSAKSMYGLLNQTVLEELRSNKRRILTRYMYYIN